MNYTFLSEFPRFKQRIENITPEKQKRKIHYIKNKSIRQYYHDCGVREFWTSSFNDIKLKELYLKIKQKLKNEPDSYYKGKNPFIGMLAYPGIFVDQNEWELEKLKRLL